MDPAVMLGEDLAEAARPVRDGTAADLAARDRKMRGLSHGHGQMGNGRMSRPSQNFKVAVPHLVPAKWGVSGNRQIIRRRKGGRREQPLPEGPPPCPARPAAG
jgi:hypothetical protein